jgi:Ca2+-binding EF-hand superfamily protein
MKIKRVLKALIKDEQKLNKLVEDAFNAIDTDGSKEIGELELFEVLKHVSKDEQFCLEDVRSAMSELDTYNNGKITLEEFKPMIIAALNFLYQREFN